jgi:hypothetical protein
MQFDKPLCRRDPIELSAAASFGTQVRKSTWASPAMANGEIKSAGAMNESYACTQS